jgi:hypothetical protein
MVSNATSKPENDDLIGETGFRKWARERRGDTDKGEEWEGLKWCV